ncbi:uncharacterized protein T551_01657 [Pneumocystis jirovecii RU7]|uniref:Uncharacterized protein n=1 Tax=Pneumocystis jirovecii (strain RU7) TaxID=1408657 RepID=A0A0W4ZRV2_PNEJ7|nr:uncharacterized protein T551_01657 [Pneumocystis jirovecii RU7]KTW31105.1 hypothetical protein T551_01657 [Pneumocystis jirovecii RU7]
MKLCLDGKNICNDFIDKTLKNNQLKKECIPLFKECHFYTQNCNNNESKCSSLKKKYEEKEIIYMPPGSDFNPTKPKTTIAKKISSEELYKEAATQRILVGGPPERDVFDLLVFLSEKTDFNEVQCKNVLTNKCDSFKYLEKELKDLCDKFKGDFEKTKVALTAKFENNLFKNNEITLWNELPNFLTKNKCAELESDCFYFESQKDFEKICKNVKIECYKRGLYELVNQVLQDKLRGNKGMCGSKRKK